MKWNFLKFFAIKDFLTVKSWKNSFGWGKFFHATVDVCVLDGKKQKKVFSVLFLNFPQIFFLRFCMKFGMQLCEWIIKNLSTVWKNKHGWYFFIIFLVIAQKRILFLEKIRKYLKQFSMERQFCVEFVVLKWLFID